MMALKSDITIDYAKFDPSNISEQTAKVNQHLIDISESAPQWYDIGALKYREMRGNGETPFPKPKLLPQALDITIPSRDAGRNIPCRLIYPTSRTTCKGTMIHFHGGGWVLGDHKSHDTLLQLYADTGDLAVISVGYRLAPEDPFPKGPEDCVDIGEHLVRNSVEEYGGPVRFIGGESAGAHLSLLITFHLLKIHPTFKLSGLVLHFGVFDLTGLAEAKNFTKTLILNSKIMDNFTKAFLPGKTLEEMKDPSISPYYEDLNRYRGRLPSAFFTCGTEDPLLGDSVVMATRWMTSGGEAIIKIYPGACHGFIGFDSNLLAEAGKALQDTKTYIKNSMI